MYSTSFSIASFPCFSTSLLDFYFFSFCSVPFRILFLFLYFWFLTEIRTCDLLVPCKRQAGALTTYQRIILSTLVYFPPIYLFSFLSTLQFPFSIQFLTQCLLPPFTMPPLSKHKLSFLSSS